MTADPATPPARARGRWWLAALWLAAAPPLAAAEPPAAAEPGAEEVAVLETSAGAMVFRLFERQAPLTTRNFAIATAEVEEQWLGEVAFHKPLEPVFVERAILESRRLGREEPQAPRSAGAGRKQ